MSEAPIFTITDVAFGGKGVARHDGKVFFIPFTAPGDVVLGTITRSKKNFGEAVVQQVITPSPDRVEPRCPWFGQCGGCAYQHMAYPAQVELKHRQVEQTIRRLGRFETVPMQPMIPAPAHYDYRNRIRVHVIDGRAGFYAHGSHDLVQIGHCVIAKPELNADLATLRKRKMQDGDYLLAASKGGVFFEQTNDSVAAELGALVERTALRDQALLVDAYCGAGFFARRLAPHFPSTIGIEENEQAIFQANKKAGPTERYIAGDVAVHLSEVLATGDAAKTTIVLDPPAAGLSTRVVEILLTSGVSQLIYVSCDPATLARDLAALAAVYEMKAVTPLDMFPQTAEVEVCVDLRLR
jgi:23S rRNA (uracil1939-C5)-methyltransferase